MRFGLFGLLAVGCVQTPTPQRQPEVVQGPPGASEPSGIAADYTPLFNELNDHCRTKYLMLLRDLDAQLGARCGTPTTMVTFSDFKRGIIDGNGDYAEFMFAMAAVCSCVAESCPAGQNENARIRLKNVTTALPNKIDAGTSRTAEAVASRGDCLDGAIAGQIYNVGYKCGFDETAGIWMAHQELVKLFPNSSGDHERAQRIVQSCFPNGAAP